MDEGWFVFSKNRHAQKHGLSKSKKGTWWQRCATEDDAIVLRDKIKGRTWIAPVEAVTRRPPPHMPVQQYGPPSRAALKERAMEREKALADFAAGIDWPPWEHGPIAA